MQAIVQNGKFSVQANVADLVNHQHISADITVHDAAGNEAHAQNMHSYQVQTHIDQPSITINTIAGDDVVNADEAKGMVAISGSVSNVVDGREITVQCGCPSCTAMRWLERHATVKDGKFSVDFSGSELAGLSQDVQNMVKILVKNEDDAGNVATAEAERLFRVDTVAPTPHIIVDSILIRTN